MNSNLPVMIRDALSFSRIEKTDHCDYTYNGMPETLHECIEFADRTFATHRFSKEEKELYLPTIQKWWEDFNIKNPDNMNEIEVKCKVTDGECEGTVKKVLTSFDYSGNAVKCIAVKCPKEKEDFQCTRMDWWRRV